MRNWRAIKRDIYDALEDYNILNVEYDGPGDGECSAFFIYIDGEEDVDDVISELNWVLDEYDLSVDNWYLDEDSDWVLQLNAYWDD